MSRRLMPVGLTGFGTGLALVGSVATACGAGGGSRPAITGTVRGGTGMYRPGAPTASVPPPMNHAYVEALSSDGVKVVTHSFTNAAGRFTLHLSQGTFVIRTCGDTQRVTVRSDQTVTVNLLCKSA